jgi:hypothetical protein
VGTAILYGGIDHLDGHSNHGFFDLRDRPEMKALVYRNKKSPQQAAGYWWSEIRTGLTACFHEFFCIPAPGFARTFLSSPRRRACQPYSRNTVLSQIFA